MSLFSLIELSRRSFRALDGAMNTVGQNVANAETEGYTRRRVTLQAEGAVLQGIHTRPAGRFATGAGVSIETYERLRDSLLAGAGWEAQGGLSASQEEHRILSTLEGLLPSGGPGSLTDLLDGFWRAWSDAADHPTDGGVRRALRSQAAALASALNRLDRDVAALQAETRSALASGIDEANDLLKEIAALNKSIEVARHSGAPDLAAEDRRDQLVKTLAAFAPIRVQQEARGGYTVTIQGMAVVQGDQVMALALDTAGSTPQVLFGNTGIALRTQPGQDGRLGAWLRSLTDTLPDARTQLDRLARALVTEVNALHTARYDENGTRQPDGPAFFHYSPGPPEEGATAAAIRLSDAVLADAGVIAAPGFYTADGEETALAIAALRTTGLSDTGGETAETFTIDLLAEIGAKVSQAASRATAQQAAADYLEGMERSVSGVSVDEELTKLIQYQQAFGASARVLQTAQEMMDTLLAI